MTTHACVQIFDAKLTDIVFKDLIWNKNKAGWKRQGRESAS